ncbi:DUF3035 domain-containing protein [Pedomonas sp. V897]|uniref:DUF3035 domain-containing protein n=1 Tax=Pedomonas sp. V897 TaxID=3446482 RepID=UPI003EE1A359
MISTRTLIGLGAVALLALSGCGSRPKSFSASAGPNELAVTRQAPLVVPPDFNLRPPRPGEPRPHEVDAQSQAIEALFGTGVQLPPKSDGEQALLDAAGAGRVTPDIRSALRDDGTVVADKGAFLKELLDAQPGDRQPEIATVAKAG